MKSTPLCWLYVASKCFVAHCNCCWSRMYTQSVYSPTHPLPLSPVAVSARRRPVRPAVVWTARICSPCKCVCFIYNKYTHVYIHIWNTVVVALWATRRRTVVVDWICVVLCEYRWAKCWLLPLVQSTAHGANTHTPHHITHTHTHCSASTWCVRIHNITSSGCISRAAVLLKYITIKKYRTDYWNE